MGATETDRRASTVPLVRAAYQPVVHLASGRVVAYEALARGPEGTAMESPAALFAAAAESDATAELDWRCRGVAVAGALAVDLGRSIPLFVNVEPSSLSSRPPVEVAALHARAETELHIMLEITERHLLADPAGLLAAVERARRDGYGLALDDVGADPASLALLSFVDPDVVKLDMSVVQNAFGEQAATIATAVMAHAERTGATILAEGIEGHEHLLKANALGATLGQGWLFGRPVPLPGRIDPPDVNVAWRRPRPDVARTPFEAAQQWRLPRICTKQFLREISHLMELRAFEGEPPVVLAAFQHASRFTPGTARRYRELADRCALVVALGTDLPASPVAGVRGGSLQGDDPLRDEWTVAVVGPHFAGALIARDLGDSGRDADRRFEYVVTYDRSLVLVAARSLMSRVAPA